MTAMKETFKSIYPDKYFADLEDLNELSNYLKSISFLISDESVISAVVPGAGNMNFVIRVITDQRSFILKQSRPWVEKYPTIAAPIGRVNIESEFYAILADNQKLLSTSPKILHTDPDNFILIIEDLGEVDDYTFLYNQGVSIKPLEVEQLAVYLAELHSISDIKFPENMDMRKLNHEHIFHYPFISDNGFDLESVQQGLSVLAINEKSNPDLVAAIAKQGETYLTTGDGVLLHGDFYPGSWMKSERLFVLDVEFSFVGPASFDIGVFVAHMHIALQDESLIDLFINSYKIKHKNIDSADIFSFAGIEVLRRLLGVAQLPVDLSISQKSDLINKAKNWILNS